MVAAKVISGESNEGATGGVADGAESESKTLVENSRDKGVSSENVIKAGGNEAVGSGRLIIKDKYAALSKNRIVEVRSQNSRWDSWGVMNMVGRVLGGKFSVDDEVEDSKTSEIVGKKGVSTSEIGREADVVVDRSANKSDIERVVADKCSDELILDVFDGETSPNEKKDFEGLVKGTGLNGAKDSDGLVEVTGSNGVKDSDGLVEVTGLNVVKDLDGLVVGSDLNGKKDLDGLVAGTGLNGEKDLVDSVNGTGLNREGDLDNLVEGTGLKEVQDSISNELMETEKVNAVEYGTYLVPKPRGEHQIAEKEGEYYVSDLIWGKVKSHPWWPGQIFPPIAASDEAAKHIKKQSYLIAYFGDKSFAWNEGSNIRHFRTNFSQMEKQGNSDEYFFHAVSCALDEVARRVEFGLLCNCVNQEVHDEVKHQVVSNDGIWEGNNVNEGGDSLSMAPLFLPGSLMQFLESAAECSSQSKKNKLEFTIAKAQLLAFNRWKGRHELPVFEQYFGLLEDNAQITAKGDELDDFSDGPSTKRRHLDELVFPIIKEKPISSFMSSSAMVFPCVVEEPLKKRKRGRPFGSGKNSKGHNFLASNSNESELVEIIPTEIPTPDVILSRVILSAKVPMQGFNIMISDIDFLREFRNLICLEKTSGDEKGIQNHTGLTESYWTDRIIQEEQVVLEPKNVMDLDLEKTLEESQPTALIMNFTNLDSIPSVPNLNEIFRRYGPLKESETKILSKRVEVIFKRRADAETAFSSSWKYSIFGPSLTSFRLHYEPTHHKDSAED